MMSTSTIKLAAKFLIEIGEVERKVEASRNSLARQPSFNPHSMFDHIDGQSNGFISSADLQQFLAAHQIEYNHESLRDLFLNWDKDRDGKIGFSDFSDSIKPQKREIEHSKPIQRRGCGSHSNEVRIYLSQLMEQDLNYYTQINARRQKLNNRPDFSVKTIFDKICKRPSPRSFCEEELRLFLRNQGCIALPEVLHAIFRRVDKDKDDLISYVEFTESMLQPKFDQSVRGSQTSTQKRSLSAFTRTFVNSRNIKKLDQSSEAKNPFELVETALQRDSMESETRSIKLAGRSQSALRPSITALSGQTRLQAALLSSVRQQVDRQSSPPRITQPTRPPSQILHQFPSNLEVSRISHSPKRLLQAQRSSQQEDRQSSPPRIPEPIRSTSLILHQSPSILEVPKMSPSPKHSLQAQRSTNPLRAPKLQRSSWQLTSPEKRNTSPLRSPKVQRSDAYLLQYEPNRSTSPLLRASPYRSSSPLRSSPNRGLAELLPVPQTPKFSPFRRIADTMRQINQSSNALGTDAPVTPARQIRRSLAASPKSLSPERSPERDNPLTLTELRTPQKSTLQTAQISPPKTQKSPLKTAQSSPSKSRVENFKRKTPHPKVMEIFLKQIEIDMKLDSAKQELAICRDFNYLQAFSLFDREGNGGFTLSEMDDALRDMGMDPPQDVLWILFRHYDLNNEGLIRLPQFIEMICTSKVDYDDIVQRRQTGTGPFIRQTMQCMKDLFKTHFESEIEVESLRKYALQSHFSAHAAFDSLPCDERNEVTEETLKFMFKEQRKYVTRQNLKSLMDRYDRNRDGKITYSEFVQEIATKSPRKYT